MSAPAPQLLADSVECLMSLGRDGVRPAEAQGHIRRLAALYPGTDMELLWELEPYDHSVHYDVLLRHSADCTVSLAVSGGRALPWPMRGVQRWSDSDLVRVNNTLLRVEQAIGLLDFIWDEARIATRLVDACLIQEELRKNPIELSDRELQRAVDGFRRAKQLYKAEDARRWMERRGMTQEKLEQLVGEHAKVAKLRARVAAGLVEAYFEAHRADFDSACIARIDFSDEGSAQRTYEQISSGAVGFFEAAQGSFLDASARGAPHCNGMFQLIQRGQGHADVSSAVFATDAGELLRPLSTETGYAVIRVLGRSPARLDERTRGAIEQLLFDEWLAERRQTARIEWYWGDAASSFEPGNPLAP